MTLPHQVEGNANNVLGNLLRPMLGKASVLFESTSVIAGSSGKQPDVLITSPGRSPVVIEAEYDPARTVEAEARERLGMTVENVSRPIESAVALRYPVGIDTAYDQRAVIADACLSYCVFTVERYSSDTRRAVLSVARFPESGWLGGSVSDLADFVRQMSVPQLAVDDAAKSLEHGINRAAAILNDLEGVTPTVARLLGMDDVPQTRRMACAIIANALIFHERIARIHPSIKTLKLVCGPDVSNPQRETINAWTEILKINYWPIFAIGKDILQQLPAQDAAQILKELEYTAGEYKRHRHRQRPRPDRPRLPAPHLRPQVPGHLLHLARLRCPAGPPSRRQDEWRGLGRRRRHRKVAGRRLRLRPLAPCCPLYMSRLPPTMKAPAARLRTFTR